MVLGFCRSKRRRCRVIPYVIVVAVDAHDARAIDRGVEHLSGLQVGRNEDASVEALLRGLCRNGVGKIAGRRAANGREIKSARSGESGGDNTVLEGQGGEANGVILEIEIFQAPFGGQFVRADERCAANGVWTGVAFGKREKLGIGPHVQLAAGKVFEAAALLPPVVRACGSKRESAVLPKRARQVSRGR